MGYGIVDYKAGKHKLVECGSLTTEKDEPMPNRLKTLYSGLTAIITEFEPEVASVEELFFNNNAKTAIKVGEARGAAILACANCGLDVYEYTPLQIKQAIVGYGRAPKEQMQETVKSILGLKAVLKPDDVADAVAAAMCHGNSSAYLNRVEKFTGKKLR